MADVVLNSAVRSNLRTLQSTTDLLAQTEERLATGKKINSALDGPASFFTANALDRRASDLNSLLNSVKASVQTLEAADNGIKGITEIVEGLKATARAALQSPLAVSEKAAIESNDLGVGATARNLLGGVRTATQTTLNGVADVAATHPGGVLSVNGADVTIAADATADDVVDAIEAAGIEGLTVVNDGGTLEFSLASGEDLEIDGPGALLTGLGLTADAAAGSAGSTNGAPEVPAEATTFEGIADVAATHAGGVLTINGVDVTIAADATAEDIKDAIDAETIPGLTVTDNGGTLEFSLASGEDLEIEGDSFGLLDDLGLSATGDTDTSVQSANGSELVPATPTTFAGVEDVDATHAGGTLSINGVDVSIAADASAADIKTAIDAAAIPGLTVTDNAGTLEFSLASGEDLEIDGDAALLDSLGLVADGAPASVSSDNGVPLPADAPTGLLGRTLTVKDKDGQDVSVTFGTGQNEVDSLEELNKFFESRGVLLDATFDVNARTLKISADNSIAKSTPLDVSGDATGAGAAFAIVEFSTPKLDESSATKRANFVADYNAALKEINTIAKDSNYNGVNLLMGDDLDVIFNEDGSSKMEVKGVEFSSSGVGLPEITEDQFYDSSSINEVLDQIESAFKTIEAQSSKFGSQLQIVQTREVFTKDMIGTLEDGAHSLTAADTNEEAANLATLQTRQQLIVSSLAISTQQESAVLQLLR